MVEDILLPAATRPVGFVPQRSRGATGFRPQPRPPCRLFGLDLHNGRRDEVAQELTLAALLGQRRRIGFVNAHCVNVLARDHRYSAALAGCDLLLPDGSGVRTAAKLAGEPLLDNLNGTDLFPELCRQAADAGVAIYLLGGAPGIAAAAAAAMQARFPALRVAGTHHGYFAANETAEVLAAINQSGAAMLFVGFGVPQQDVWLAEQAAALAPAVLLGVGGLFDYYSGRIPRAPLALRRIGCEWAWRLAQEPRRLARRYLIGNLLFLLAAVGWAMVARGLTARLSFGAKRALDVALAMAVLAAGLPLLVVAALAIVIEDGGPVLFRQVRIGRDGRPFRMFKFRSMVLDADRRRPHLLALSDRDATCFKMRDDPRVTHTGRWLRRLSLDELPQVLNVLRGDMSFVGPRPALPAEVVTYRPEQRERLAALPGITGVWQVEGRADVSFERQVEMDRRYVRERSLRGDLALLARTLPAVVSGRGAY